MALAMSWVNKVPAAPTTVPAMIMAALSSTKPSKPTARPVRALYREITTGMSAPPMGSVMATPQQQGKHEKQGDPQADRPGRPGPRRRTTMKPNPAVTSRMARFTNFWPPKRTDLVIKPWSFAKAIRLPLKDTEPMKPPTVAIVRCTMLCSLPRYSSTAAMAAAARRRPCRCTARSSAACRSWQRACRSHQARMPPDRDGADHQHQIEARSAHEAQGHDGGEHHAQSCPADAAHGGHGRNSCA